MEDLELYTGEGTTLNVRKRGGKNPNIYSYAARDMVEASPDTNHT
jgi:hypothetical protein